MTLKDLLEEMDVKATRGDLDVAVAALRYDSRRVARGDAFFALPGRHADGAGFARAAVEAGAGAVVSGAAAASGAPAWIEVADPRLALAQAANRFFTHPSRALEVAGVTGTNGKTTITWMLESIFRQASRAAGVIGTTGARFGGAERPLGYTTPEAPELQGLLREMADAGVRSVALEVSSHALDQKRSWGLECDVAVFTNLSHDHLDYHGTMEAYLDAKLRLFDGRNGASAKERCAVVNADDPAAPQVIEAARRGGVRVMTVGLDAGGSRPAIPLDLHVEDIVPMPDGLRLQAWLSPSGWPEAIGGRRIDPTGGETTFRLPLLGRYNATNAILAIGAAMILGVDSRDVIRGLESMPAVPGRLERVDAGQPFAVVVDYAHTPDALTRALDAVREHHGRRVLLVFGCGGDRDRAKRPVMGAIAARRADVAWVTNDNPRSEDPAAIAREIVTGASGGRIALAVELDRRAAIDRALGEARAGDVVLIAGKGHETTQTIGAEVTPFDDREVARESVAALGWAR